MHWYSSERENDALGVHWWKRRKIQNFNNHVNLIGNVGSAESLVGTHETDNGGVKRFVSQLTHGDILEVCLLRGSCRLWLTSKTKIL
jgi:hypothetical protein